MKWLYYIILVVFWIAVQTRFPESVGLWFVNSVALCLFLLKLSEKLDNWLSKHEDLS
jgi:hypothetical protein